MEKENLKIGDQSGEGCTCSKDKCSMNSVADKDEILAALTRILRREECEDSLVKLKEETKTTDESGKTVVERYERVEVAHLRPSLREVLRAAELLGKHYGCFAERVDGAITLPLIICGEEDLK